jgi:hypothetical protein
MAEANIKECKKEKEINAPRASRNKADVTRKKTRKKIQVI